MNLPKELVSQFAKLVKPVKEDTSKKETTVYGTIIENDGSKYVKIDGSEFLTPISTTVDALSGERVTVLIKNHTAIVTGNMTSPAARTGTVQSIDERTTPSKLVDLLYPIGSIYMSVAETAPENLFGGKWEQIKDTFLLASGMTYLPGSTGGKAINTLTTANLPPQTVVATDAGTSAGLAAGTSGFSALADITGSVSGVTHSVPIDNMPPYLAVYVWKRIE